MPPEPLPWDRKEFVFKERKHERNSSFDALAAAGGGGGSSTPRWREPYHRPSPRRPPPGCHRQAVSYHQLYEESNGHGFTPPRSGGGGERFWLEEERRYGGRSRGGFLRRSSPYYDPYDGPPHVTYQRSAAVPINSPSPLKDPVYDKHGGGYDQKLERDRDRENSFGGSFGWKPRWSRQGSTNSSRTAVRSEVDECWVDMPAPNTGKATPVRSPVGSPVRVDDGQQRKKPRLGWGQGLAKYEKQKVEGSANSGGKDQVSEASPKVMGMAGSTSPVTPCSAAYCSSPAGMEDRPFSKATNMENDMFHFGDSPAFDPKCILGELSINLDHLPPISTLTSLLTDLLQPEDACSGDSTCTKYTAMDKLQSYKADIAKELEKTECEIDLLENELKSLNGEGRSAPYQSALTLQDNNSPISFLGSPDGSLKVSLNLTRISSATRGIEEQVLPACSLHEREADVESSDDDNPQLLTSTGESVSFGKEISDIVVLKSVDPTVVSENIPEAQPSMPDDVLESMANAIVSRDEHKSEASASSKVDKCSHGKAGDDLIESIMASNRNAAKRASEVFDKTLPSSTQHFDMWGSDQILSCRKNDTHIKEKLALHKLQLKFKERVLTLKFRAFHHLWKEDLRLLSVRKQRPKSQKRFELNNRSSQSASQKHRSSIRSRFTLPAGNLTLVPTADIVDFTSKLLSDSHIKIFRGNLKMPALILDEKERRCSRFITKNSLVEDPLTFEKERTMINPWTQEEKGVFMEMLAKHGKDFAKISSSFSHKTTADCIEFYYKNHKSESFRDVKKQLYSRKQSQCTNNYLVTSGKKRNSEADAASLDLLGSVSVAAAHDDNHTRNQHKYAGRTFSSYHNSKVSRASYGSLEKVNGIELSVYEDETAAADVLAGICGTLSSEAVSSCVTSSVSPPEKLNTMMDLTPDVAKFIEEEDTCSDEGCGELVSVDWSDEEKSIFIEALSMYGKDFASISSCVGSKSRDQCKIFFSKGRKCLGFDMIPQARGNGELQISDANGGRSDTDDACAAEMDSAICSTQSCSKMDVDFTQSVLTTSSEAFVHAGNTSLHIENDRSSEQYELRASNQGEAQGKAVRVESNLSMEKLESEEEKLQSAKTLEEMADNSLRCNVAELSGDKESVKVENNYVSSLVEPFTSCTKGEQLKPQTSDSIEQKVTAVRRSASDVVKSEVDLQQQVVLVSETGHGDMQPQKIVMEQNNSFNISFAAESKSNTIGTASYTVSQINACPTSGLKSFASLSYLTQALPPKQDTIHSVPLSMLSSDPSSISSEGFRKISPSTISFEAHLNKPHQISASRDFYQHVLSGHPRQNETPIVLGSYSNGGISSHLNRYFVPNVNNDKCNVFEVSNSRPVMFSPRNEDESCPQLRPCSQNTCQESEEQSTHVKLFGQILSNPSPSQKSNSSSQESDSQVHLPKLKKSSTLKSSMIRKDSSPPIYPSRPGSSGQVEDVSRRSYGFWDGNNIQTGLGSLPDTGLTYQRSLAGMPIYTAKDHRASSTNNVLDYQEAYAQSLSANGRRLSELQKWNGFDIVSGLPQQGRTAVARLDVNMSGSSRSIMVGGAGVSDPVAAILAATGRAKFVASEMEPWGTDLGGR